MRKIKLKGIKQIPTNPIPFIKNNMYGETPEVWRKVSTWSYLASLGLYIVGIFLPQITILKELIGVTVAIGTIAQSQVKKDVKQDN